jgi:hypothetical protein
MASQAKQCGECGHTFAAEARELQQVEGELVELKSQAGNFKHGDLVKNKVNKDLFRICGEQRLYDGEPCYDCDKGDGTIQRVYSGKVLELVARTEDIKIGDYVNVNCSGMITKHLGAWRVWRIDDNRQKSLAYITKIKTGDPCGDGHWVELNRLSLDLKAIKRQQGTAQSLDDLRQLAQQRGYKRGWAERVYQARLAKRYGV